MAALTIRNLDAAVKSELRMRAARKGHSMEQEVRLILRDALQDQAPAGMPLGDAIRQLFEPLGGVELDLPPREHSREPPNFDE